MLEKKWLNAAIENLRFGATTGFYLTLASWPKSKVEKIGFTINSVKPLFCFYVCFRKVNLSEMRKVGQYYSNERHTFKSQLLFHISTHDKNRRDIISNASQKRLRRNVFRSAKIVQECLIRLKLCFKYLKYNIMFYRLVALSKTI